MKTNKLMPLLLVVMACSCVQPSQQRQVVLYLHLNDSVQVETVGVRGTGEPLSWQHDLVMTELIPNALYKTSFQVVTGYRFGEIKFTRNGEFELKGQPNRRVYFDDADSTVYHAIYNEPGKKK